MLNLSTSTKIYLATILSKSLIFLFQRKNFVISRNGIKYRIDLEEGVDLGIFLGVKNEKKFFNIKKYINQKEKFNIVDIGSNIGSVTLPLANTFKKSQVYSIEPTVYAFEKLKENINLNPRLRKRIKIFNYFISQKKKKIKFVHSSWKLDFHDKKHGIHRGILKETSNKAISLDNLFKKNKTPIKLIKIDVDGYELEVLKSSEKLLKKEKPIIYFELAPYLYEEMGYTVDHLNKFVKKMGYTFYNENFKPVLDTKLFSSKLTDKSINYFLFHDSFVVI
jgi:FkbM family methyltransferase